MNIMVHHVCTVAQKPFGSCTYRVAKHSSSFLFDIAYTKLRHLDLLYAFELMAGNRKTKSLPNNRKNSVTKCQSCKKGDGSLVWIAVNRIFCHTSTSIKRLSSNDQHAWLTQFRQDKWCPVMCWWAFLCLTSCQAHVTASLHVTSLLFYNNVMHSCAEGTGSYSFH
jgi:hypothetical protein